MLNTYKSYKLVDTVDLEIEIFINKTSINQTGQLDRTKDRWTKNTKTLDVFKQPLYITILNEYSVCYENGKRKVLQGTIIGTCAASGVKKPINSTNRYSGGVRTASCTLAELSISYGFQIRFYGVMQRL